MKSVTNLNYLNLRPTIVISHKGLEAIKHIVSIAPEEAQWFHTVTPVTYDESPGEIFLHLSEDLYIPKQNTATAQVDTTSSMMMEFYRELQSQYSDQELVNQKLNSMTCWCHSHHNMAPNPSTQDDSQFNSFVNSSIDQNQNVWQVMLIFNKKNQFYSRVYDPDTGLIIEGVQIHTENNYDFSYIDKAAKDKFIKKKITIPKTKFSWNSFGQSSFNFDQKELISPYEIELELALDAIDSIYGPNSKMVDKARVTTSDTSEALLATLHNLLDHKETQTLYYLLTKQSDKIVNIFTDARFAKNALPEEMLIKELLQIFTTTDCQIGYILDCFKHVFIMSELSTVKSCNKYIKENVNV